MRKIYPAEGSPYCVEIPDLDKMAKALYQKSIDSGAYMVDPKTNQLTLVNLDLLPSIDSDPKELAVAIITKNSPITGEELRLARKLNPEISIRRTAINEDCS